MPKVKNCIDVCFVSDTGESSRKMNASKVH